MSVTEHGKTEVVGVIHCGAPCSTVCTKLCIPKHFCLQQHRSSQNCHRSNCHPEVLEVLHQYYDKPHFLPEDAEHSRTDYIFIGYQQGAVMHIDYVSRLMWQAQIKGHKTWKLLPPPECDDICSPLSFRVEPGDIVLLDTRQWYHDTHIDNGEMSLTVSSEYG